MKYVQKICTGLYEIKGGVTQVVNFADVTRILLRSNCVRLYFRFPVTFESQEGAPNIPAYVLEFGTTNFNLETLYQELKGVWREFMLQQEHLCDATSEPVSKTTSVESIEIS